MTLTVPNQAAPPAPAKPLAPAYLSWAVADQVLVSAANFATMVVLARVLSPAEFGGFTLVYSVLLLANSVQMGLITQPHNSLGATMSGPDYVRYTTSTAVSQAALAAALAAATVGAWAAARAAGWGPAPLLAALAPAVAAWQAQEFFRRVLYTEDRVAAAFGNDLISYGGQAVAVVALARFGALTGPAALAALAATSAAGAAVGAAQLRPSLAGRFDPADVRENWQFGKWLAGNEVLGGWLSSQVYLFLTAAVTGASGAGVLKAVNTVFGPTRALAYVFNSVLPIRFARTLSGLGPGGLRDQVRSAFLVAVPVLGGYCLAAAVFAGPLLSLLYGDRYAGQGPVLALYAGFMFVTYAAMLYAAALRALRLTRAVFASRVYSGLVTIPAGWLSTLAWGVPGAVIGMTVSSLVLCLLSRRAFRRGVIDEG